MEPGKWIWLKDRLPDAAEQNEILWIAYVRTDNTVKYVCEALFDNDAKEFFTYNDWGNKDYFLEPSVWMAVPQPTPRKED